MNEIYETLERIMRSDAYKIFVIFVVMPTNGCLVGSGDTLEVTIGVLSSIVQVPWVLSLNYNQQ